MERKTLNEWYEADTDPDRPSMSTVQRGAKALDLPKAGPKVYYISEAQYEQAKAHGYGPGKGRPRGKVVRLEDRGKVAM